MIDWLNQQDAAWRAGITRVSMDTSATYVLAAREYQGWFVFVTPANQDAASMEIGLDRWEVLWVTVANSFMETGLWSEPHLRQSSVRSYREWAAPCSAAAGSIWRRLAAGRVFR